MTGVDPPTPTDLFGNPDPATPPRPVGFVTVAPERGVDLGAGGFTYSIPPALADLKVGDRVIVPLGRGDKPVAGFVLDRAEHSPLPPEKLGRIKSVLERDAQATSLPEDLIRLARWIASYYVCPLGMVFGTMLPAAVKHGTGATLRTLVALPEGGQIDAKLTKLQRAVVQALEQETAAGRPWIDLHALAELAAARSIAPVKSLIDKGALRTRQSQVVVSDLDLRAVRELHQTPPARLKLSPQQHVALQHLEEHMDKGFSVHLVHGVTGSGKTEVYLRAIERRLRDTGASQPSGAADASPVMATHSPGIIVLVPEIALTPQTVGRFLGRFPHESVAVLHSGLTAAQRHVQWRRIASGEAHIVVGARSAIFAPLANPRLIIVDEEHESSYKQDQLPRYHARDVAIKRGQLLDIPVILGSATPSLESYHNAVAATAVTNSASISDHADPSRKSTIDNRKFAYHLVSLPDRVPGMALPRVEIVDMCDDRRQRRGIHLLSQRLEYELARVLKLGSGGGAAALPEGDELPVVSDVPFAQAILLLNRRGYANYIACPDHGCGWMMRCDHCDVTMVYHLDRKLPRGGVVRCHHCGAEQMLEHNCPQCGNKTSVFGLGTQKVEEELHRKFPGARTIRMDSDSMRSARHYQEALDQFREGRADILLGTQMIAKGLDFPGVRLVGVISGDTSPHIADFRASERNFQLISQVSGRSGRSSEAGKVVVQTFNPDDPVIALAAAHDYTGFAARELALRVEMGLPPSSRMARIVVRDRDKTKAAADASTLAVHLGAFNESLGLGIRLRGPSACPLSRIADHYRHQIELIAPPPEAAGKLQKLMTALRNARLLKSDAHTAVDVDPVALM